MEGINETMKREGDHSPHQKAKRKLKTPAQLEALEKFFNESKYPSEAMKWDFAEKTGLSEKQVSGWLCHRRLKDKKILQGEIYTNGKHNLSSSVIHDRTSGVKQESCSSTKQVDRNLDSKEVESKMYYGYKSSFGELAYEAHNQNSYAGHNRVMEGSSSSSSSSASHGSHLQSNENLCNTQPSRYQFCNDTSMLVHNKSTGIKSNEYTVDSRRLVLQDENDATAISALKWKLGKHYREDGPPLGSQFDPLPPGSFDSPVQDLKCEPYYIGDSIQHESSSLCRTINEPRVYDKYNIEKRLNKAYEEQRSFKRTKPGFTDCSLKSTQNLFSSQHNHVQHEAISMDETEKSTNRTSLLNGRNNLRCFKTAGEYDSKTGYNLHQSSFTYPSYGSQDFHGENLDTKPPFPAARMKYESINSEHRNQPHNLLKDKIRKETAKRKHCVLQPEMPTSNKARTVEKMNSVELWRQQFAGKSLEKSARQVPFTRHPFDAESSLQQDMSGDTFSSLD
ncbi:hypothetical protein KSP39_PZI008990 [Platanthera zijinensis]|uniref:Homeobox domain-containing protein n=1 Tax=Platanthera zijinensis TaxID=2320716 RepID=A0AAP0BKA8_9ASPA